MRYVQVYFSDLDDADQHLRTIHNKTDNSVLWECPTQDGINRTVADLRKYESDNPDILDGEAACGYPNREFAGAWTERVEMDNEVYILTYNVGLGYVGLEREIPDITLNFPHMPPIRGVGPVITEVPVETDSCRTCGNTELDLDEYGDCGKCADETDI